MSAFLDYARGYRAAGLYPLPARPDEKRPWGKAWNHEAINGDFAQRWAAAENNLGAVPILGCMAPERCAWLDFDRKNGCDGFLWLQYEIIADDEAPDDAKADLEAWLREHLPCATTPTGGCHALVRVPKDVRMDQLPPIAMVEGMEVGVDVRRHGTEMVIVAPSPGYTWDAEHCDPEAGIWPVPVEAPMWLLRPLIAAQESESKGKHRGEPMQPGEVTTKTVRNPRQWVTAAGVGCLDEVGQARRGTRQKTLYERARRMGRLLINDVFARDEAVAELTKAARLLAKDDGDRVVSGAVERGLDWGSQYPLLIEKHEITSDVIHVPGNHADVGEVREGEFSEAVLDAMPDDVLFKYGDALLNPSNNTRRNVKIAALRRVASHHTRLAIVGESKNGEMHNTPKRWTADLASLVRSCAMHGHPSVRPIRGVVTIPMPYRDTSGALCFCEPGYNECGLYYAEPEALRDVAPMTDMNAAYLALRDPIRLFPFAPFPFDTVEDDDGGASDVPDSGNTAFSSETIVYAYMVLLFAWPLLDPDDHIPGVVSMGSTRGVGKTTLLQAACLQTTGLLPLTRSLPDRIEDMPDLVTSILRKADERSVLFDNVRAGKAIANTHLETLITGRWWGDRGKYQELAEGLPNNLVWMMSVRTGTKLNADLASRCMGIYLDAEREKPEDVSFPFKPFARARENHRDAVAALMGALKAWDRSEDRGPAACVPESRFDGARELVGGVLRVMDEGLGSSFLGNAEAFSRYGYKDADPLARIITAWVASGLDHTKTTRTSTLFSGVVKNIELPIHGDSSQDLGRFLATMDGEIRGGWRFKRGSHGGKPTHRLVAVKAK